MKAAEIARDIMIRARKQAQGIREEWLFGEIVDTLEPLLIVHDHAKNLVTTDFSDPAIGWPKFIGHSESVSVNDEVRGHLVAIRRWMRR